MVKLGDLHCARPLAGPYNSKNASPSILGNVLAIFNSY